MTPLLERQPDAASAGARTDEAQLTPPPTPGAQDSAAKARSRRRPAGGDEAAGSAREGAFVCRTCSRRFPSFQALGGHRTGHTRLQARRALPLQQQQKPARAAHECAVCGLEFAMGQALGGHMRRHKNDDAQALVEVEAEGKQQAQAQARVEEEKQRSEEEANCTPPLEDRCGGDREGCSSGSGSEPRLLNLLV